MAPSSTKLRIILLLVVLILIITFASALYSLSVRTSNTDSASPNLAATVNAAANTEEGSRRLGIDLIIRDETLNASSNGLGNATACGFQGNSDIYGLGIRLGIYFQWAATLLSYLFLRESIDDVAAANWIFLIATVIATLVITAARSSLNTYSAEVVIMLYFVFGQITICLMPIIGNGPANYTILGAWGVVSCFLAVAIYESWFWINGRVSMTQTPCGTFMFMFKKVSITDVKNVSAATIVFIPVAIISGGLWFLASWKLIRRLKREYTEIEQSLQQQDSPRPKGIWNGMLRFVFAVTRSVGDESTTTRNRFETIFVYWHLFSKDHFFVVPLLASIPIAVFCLIGVETTLSWNRISGVSTVRSTGQFIPLIIGLGGILNVLMQLADIYLRKLFDKPETAATENATHGADTASRHSGH